VKDARVGQPASLPSDAFVVLEPPAEAAAARPADAKHGRERDWQAGIVIEVVRGQPSAELDGYWRDLVMRADEANVFMQPRVMRAAPRRALVALLAWQNRGSERRLCGFWAFSIGKPHLSLIPLSALRAPATDHAYLSVPVIDRDCLEPALHAMLDAIVDVPDLPKFVALESMSGSGATFDALMRVLAQRGGRYCHLDGKPRPILVPGGNAASYLEKAFSGGSRKKLRQQRRRLSKMGALQTRIATTAGDVRTAFEAFLTLELQGWKGRRGTAILNHPDETAFARDLIADLAEAGDVSIYALELDGRPISMQIVLRAEGAVYTWKTAYDEALADFSPGMLLFEDYSKAFLADHSIAFADSCAFDDTGYMAAWQERKVVVDLWLDPRRGGSTWFAAVAGMQKSYLPLRDAAKQMYLRSAILQKLRRALVSRRVTPSRDPKRAVTRAERFVRA
jgi:hypothetical protein